MKALPKKGIAAITGIGLAITLSGCTFGEAEASTYTTREVSDGTTDFVVVENPNGGAQLSYGAEGGIELLEVEDGGATLAFKDMNANGELDTWEDWRVDSSERAADLAADMSIEQIAGLMLFSSHERSPADGLTDAQKTYLDESNLRAVLNAAGSNADETVPWVNEMQAYVETLATADTPYVPVNFASDPRSTAGSGGYNADGADISRWPSNLGLAATFNAEYTEQFGEMASAEYRALGITTALSPQVDLATEPRWSRVAGTFGEDSEQAAELTAAYVDGFQGSEGADEWGTESVNAMIKHFSGDGPGEGGREAHTQSGKYGVYPGDNLDEHVSVFQAALNSASVMTAYSIALDADGNPLFDDRMGTAYDSGRMSILRDDNSYEGVIVTDWGVMSGSDDEGAMFGMAWGAEDLTPAERYVKVLGTGHDMFGGVNDATYILEAADLWQDQYEAGEQDVDALTRFQQSGTRILNMIFQVGLYESAFLVPEESAEILASADKVEAGYNAQLDSVVMLKNDGTIAADTDWSDKTVYIPQSYDIGIAGAFGPGEYTEGATLDLEVAAEYFGEVVTDEVEYEEDGTTVKSYTAPDLSDVDLVIVGMDSPNSGGTFTNAGLTIAEDGTKTWTPISLQYGEYVADGDNVRKTSIGGDILADGTVENRSYYGNTAFITNAADLDAFERAVKAVEDSGKDIPVITALKAVNPTIPAEFEADSDAILVSFGTSDQAIFDIATGVHEPAGRLPIQFPKDMDTVEAQYEDVAKDMTPYTDAAGNVYDYGFGLNYAGVISD
ncbi:MAG: glycoside hydrolase family 3 [Microbacterium sp. SCN 70-200]|uniref:glycoside hydrolase family 3 N-terminal domain-containing protein n=1 Tax=unclassified Microbacterium TaxID=2609290 RepID=UPI000868BFA9|nr:MULTISPECIES: glycoside hydrolase family 3 N-terminal domain-containing protein [unclassified Microbacterium]MBN9215565.1 glycoside hydrolase family 3 C-terminal domain-containing protein [Microbacterium sp.]ODT41193.1 MAG: glycoside hydrolase family 3 [Microbacterium sp. SCN 70-200]OJV79411.1 MAG: glycoside hydrolase family 3 [Microbacterium sp. 70-16]